MAYDTFNNSLARTESGGRYDVVNSEGYGGKYQFGQARLDDFNSANGTNYTVAELVKNPSLQENVQNWHVADIDKFVSQNGLDRFIGQDVGGITLTKDSLRAMAHLGGKGGMMKYLQSGGSYNPSDSNGTSLSDYAGTHRGGTAPQNTLNAPTTQPQAPDNALAAIRPPVFKANLLNAADFMTQNNNQLATAGFDQNTNPFLRGM